MEELILSNPPSPNVFEPRLEEILTKHFLIPSYNLPYGNSNNFFPPILFLTIDQIIPRVFICPTEFSFASYGLRVIIIINQYRP